MKFIDNHDEIIAYDQTIAITTCIKYQFGLGKKIKLWLNIDDSIQFYSLLSWFVFDVNLKILFHPSMVVIQYLFSSSFYKSNEINVAAIRFINQF